MLEKYERGAQRLAAADAPGGVVVAATLARTARPGPPTADGYGCGNHRIKLASELQFQKSIEIVHP